MPEKGPNPRLLETMAQLLRCHHGLIAPQEVTESHSLGRPAVDREAALFHALLLITSPCGCLSLGAE